MNSSVVDGNIFINVFFSCKAINLGYACSQYADYFDIYLHCYCIIIIIDIVYFLLIF